MKTNKSKPLRVGSARSRARKFLTNTLFNKQSPSMIIHIHYSIYFTLNQMKLICSLFSLFLIIIHSQHCVLYSALCLSLLRCCCCCWCCLAATLGCALAALCRLQRLMRLLPFSSVAVAEFSSGSQSTGLCAWISRSLGMQTHSLAD